MRTGNFGQVREAYAKARLIFPDEVIQYIIQSIPESSSSILDLGCGTGIGTRQLYEKGVTVIGSDVDAEMIEEARKASPGISYIVAPTHSLPFRSGQFDAATAFSAFHWFRDDGSLTEIKRVLKPGGTFIVVNKNDVDGFRIGYREKLEQFLGRKVSSPKKDYSPEEILTKNGFTEVATQSFMTEEIFDLNGALQHIQSASIWAEVSLDQQDEAIRIMRDHVLSSTIDGRIARQLEVRIVTGSY